MKEYNYVNALGYHKKLVVGPIDKNGKYPVTLWCTDNGEFCGSGKFTSEELKDWLNHYGIEVA